MSEQTFDRGAFEARVQAGIAKFNALRLRWPLTADELCQSYTAGIRDFRGADLSRANLSGANLSRANLSGADLSGANLRRANLSGANLSGANLFGADLLGANLFGADLLGANLSEANLSEANLSRANLSGANLSGANLSEANLSGANTIFILGPIGSRGDLLYAVSHADGLRLKTGCFWGTLEEFKAKNDRRSESQHRSDYQALYSFLDYWQARELKMMSEKVENDDQG